MPDHTDVVVVVVVAIRPDQTEVVMVVVVFGPVWSG
jgi:hypothetical protein